MDKFVRSPPRGVDRGAWWYTLIGFVLLLGYDAAGADLPIARLAASGGYFDLREHWLLAGPLHGGVRLLAWAVALWLLAGLWWPTGVLRRIPRSARLQWLAGVLVSLLLVNAFKHVSLSSCPWDVIEFGGFASYTSHWGWPVGDGGPGHCFPAGHASAGFAFVGGYFALRRFVPRSARTCLWASLATGLMLGLVQQLRGAHFMSHTLWTAWICWAASLATHAVAQLATKPAVGIRAEHETA